MRESPRRPRRGEGSGARGGTESTQVGRPEDRRGMEGKGAFAAFEERPVLSPRVFPFLGVAAVNGFHVHAFGWALVFNARAFSAREAEEVSGLWGALLRARLEEKGQGFLRLLLPRSLPLSPKSLLAFAELATRVTAMHPETFSLKAVRLRRNQWALQALFLLISGLVAASWLPRVSPIAAETILTLFLLGLASLVPTMILWRASSALKRLRKFPGNFA